MSEWDIDAITESEREQILNWSRERIPIATQAERLQRSRWRVRGTRRKFIEDGLVPRSRHKREPAPYEAATEAFAAMYAAHWEGVFRTILRNVRDYDAAEDICVNVFDYALRTWQKYEGGRTLNLPYRNWLTRIAFYGIRFWRCDEYRRRQRIVPFYGARGDDDEMPEDHDPALIDPTTASLFDRIENAMAYAFMRAALPKLPAPHQQALHLHFGASLPVEQAAAQMNIPLRSFQFLLHQALARLSAVMVAQGWDANET